MSLIADIIAQDPVGMKQLRAARALALLRGRRHVKTDDIRDLAADVLRHRLVLSYDALADGVPVDVILGRLLQAIPMPQVSPYTHAGPA